jgi:hypothetical protein
MLGSVICVCVWGGGGERRGAHHFLLFLKARRATDGNCVG